VSSLTFSRQGSSRSGYHFESVGSVANGRRSPGRGTRLESNSSCRASHAARTTSVGARTKSSNRSAANLPCSPSSSASRYALCQCAATILSCSLVFGAEQRMVEIRAVRQAPERSRENGHAVANEAELVRGDPVLRVSAHADDGPIARQATGASVVPVPCKPSTKIGRSSGTRSTDRSRRVGEYRQRSRRRSRSILTATVRREK
jgi:hypothetical protein